MIWNFSRVSSDSPRGTILHLNLYLFTPSPRIRAGPNWRYRQGSSLSTLSAVSDRTQPMRFACRPFQVTYTSQVKLKVYLATKLPDTPSQLHSTFGKQHIANESIDSGNVVLKHMHHSTVVCPRITTRLALQSWFFKSQTIYYIESQKYIFPGLAVYCDRLNMPLNDCYHS